MINWMKGSYFVRLIMSHLVLMVVIVIVGGGFILNKTAKMMDDEMRSTGVSQLQELRGRLEEQQLEKFNSVFLNKVLSTVRIESESEIQYFLDRGKNNNYYRIVRLTQDLKTLLMSLPALHNLSYYFLNDDFVVDRYFYNSPTTSPQAELLSSTEPIPVHQWFMRNIPDLSKDNTAKDVSHLNVLTYVYTLPYMAQGDQVKGYMIIDLDVEYMVSVMGEHMSDMNEKLLVLDDSGEVLGASEPWSDTMLQVVRNSLTDQADTMIKQEEVVLSILPARYSDFRWHYAIMRPQHSVQLTTQKMKQGLWLAALSILLLGSVLAYVVSRWCYSTFRYVTQRIKTVTGHIKSSGFDNEIKWLEQAFGRLDWQKQAYMSELRKRQWRDMIQGAVISDQELVIPSGMRYIALSLELHGGDSTIYENKFQEQLVSYELGGGEWISVSATEVVIVYWGAQSGAELEEAIAGHFAECGKSMTDSFRVIAGIGSVSEKPEDIHLSVTEARIARRYGFMSDHSAWIHYREVEERQGCIPELNIEPLETLLRSGERDQIERFLLQMQTQLTDGSYSIEGVELIIMQLHLILSKAKMMLDGNSSELTTYLKPANLVDAFEKMRSDGQVIFDQRSEKQDDRYKRMMGEVKTYVDRHLHEDLSLDHLSEMTSYSRQFICKLFKEEMYMTFVDYLTHQRLEHAKGLLIRTEDSVGSIALQSGFRSSQYFSNKFKAQYSVTPVQYRKANADI